MTEQKLRELYDLLDEYQKEKYKTCEFDCNNCLLGAMESHYDSCSCSIDFVMKAIDAELPVKTDIDRTIARIIERKFGNSGK